MPKVRHEIVKGPDRFAMFASMAMLVPIEFETGNTIFNLRLNRIEQESIDGNSWAFGGYIIVSKVESFRFGCTGCYRTDTYTGHIDVEY